MADPMHKYLPLTESTYYILLTLTEPLHGYAVMQKVAEISHGTVDVGRGTLYGAFPTLEKEGLIEKASEENWRKSYRLTPNGAEILATQVQRLQGESEGGGAA